MDAKVSFVWERNVFNNVPAGHLSWFFN